METDMTTPFFPTDTPETAPDSAPAIPKELPVHMVIRELCGDLARSMNTPAHDLSVLDEQVQILNALFNATLAERLNMAKQRYDSDDAMNRGWLELALKIQKQCMETVRTRQASEYLGSLSDLHGMKMRRVQSAADDKD